MADALANAVQTFVNRCPYVVAVHDLITKTRIGLQKGYAVDLYYNATLGKYGYTLISGGRRIIGWDNARHHPGLANFPHHFHREDGTVESSWLTGDPEQDILTVVSGVNVILADDAIHY